SCAAPSAKGDDKFITTDYLQQCRQKCVCVLLQCDLVARPSSFIPLLLRAKSKQYDFFLAT
ncbi:hypothetical protein, partial [Enterobacter cloacae complex sp. CDL008]